MRTYCDILIDVLICVYALICIDVLICIVVLICIDVITCVNVLMDVGVLSDVGRRLPLNRGKFGRNFARNRYWKKKTKAEKKTKKRGNRSG